MVKSRALLSVIGLLFVVGIAGVVYIYSKNAENPLLPSSSPRASGAGIQITERWVDPFNTGEIDKQKWKVQTEAGAVVKQESDNLRMELPAGSATPSASLIFKELIKDRGDFKIVAVVYKPQVTGNGAGISGVRFASEGTDNQETATVRWRIAQGSSKVTFVVRGPDGRVMESETLDLAGDVALLRLDRINKEYTAYFKPGRDTSSDTNWRTLGTLRAPSLGKDGWISLFTTSSGTAASKPAVVGRFDQANVAWEGDPIDIQRANFHDAFSDGNLGRAWRVRARAGATAEERPSNNLVMTVPTGAVTGKPNVVIVRRDTPVAGQDKDFILQTVLFKPTVNGAGLGAAGLTFTSTGSEDDEAAKVFWRVGNNTSAVVFSVKNPDGTVADTAEVSIPAEERSITLRLVRNGKAYSAYYRTGDLDTEFVKVGSEKTAEFGSSGKASLFVSNMGANNQFPKVVGRFDQAFGSIVK